MILTVYEERKKILYPMFRRKIAAMVTIIVLSGLFHKVKAQGLQSGRLNSLRLSESFVRGNSNLSVLTVLGYRYQFSEEIKFGADLGYHTGTYYDSKVKEYNSAVSIDFTYSHGRTVELYGSASTGYGLFTGNHANKFLYQINPLAMRIGNGSIAGFGELGWGYRGLLTAGIAYKF
ncbi:hypothetical protein AY601_1925 [Pedobacter cryoconitis]|uniref:Outer membrane protein beta-barrel domain-containing protein n=2 Tax=Pedobacter cryoconitis TaxID=188932 RepID=A0A127VBR4_9SPHI|nr:hypothetical protein AY601_1925 [Pedobacter cryoconitis]